MKATKSSCKWLSILFTQQKPIIPWQADWYSFGASAFMLLSGCIPPPEHSRDYEMDRTDIAPADQTFILALVFEVLKTIDDVLRHEWFHQVDMLAVLQTRPPPMDTGTALPLRQGGAAQERGAEDRGRPGRPRGRPQAAVPRVHAGRGFLATHHVTDKNNSNLIYPMN